MNIGKSVVIKGELNGSEDLTIEGHVEGKIELREHVLTIGPNGKIKAELFAKSVVVLGEVIGNVSATEKVDIRENGSVDGDITSPRVAIAEGAHFRGSVDMAATRASSPQQAQQAKPRRSPQVTPDRKPQPRPAACPVSRSAGPASGSLEAVALGSPQGSERGGGSGRRARRRRSEYSHQGAPKVSRQFDARARLRS